jgi:hypothetical protein
MKKEAEIGESEEEMWNKHDLWILEEAMTISSGKVIKFKFINLL